VVYPAYERVEVIRIVSDVLLSDAPLLTIDIGLEQFMLSAALRTSRTRAGSSQFCAIQLVRFARMSSTNRTEPLRNVLAQSKSPYLLQHKDNPVAVSSLTAEMKLSLNSYQWQEFTPETIALASQLDKPIFLSSGYSACHWSVLILIIWLQKNDTRIWSSLS
jgi:hypothetical protein